MSGGGTRAAPPRPDTPTAAAARAVAGWIAAGWTPFVLTTAAAAGAAILLATVDPNEPGHYPLCPMLATTGLYCPGCGSLRAVHDLLHADPAGAMARNPLAVLAVPLLLLAWIGWARRLSGRPAPHPTALPSAGVWGLLAVVLSFWVLRNLPRMVWLSPL